MNQPRLSDHGATWSSSIATLATVYNASEDDVAVAAYALSEQIHRFYCLQKGIVMHSEPRPDQQVAISIMMALAGTDWWVVRSSRVMNNRPDWVGEAIEPAAWVGDPTPPPKPLMTAPVVEEVIPSVPLDHPAEFGFTQPGEPGVSVLPLMPDDAAKSG